MVGYELNTTLRPGYPDFNDLPWDYPLLEWHTSCSRYEEVSRGLSRHPVVFVNFDGDLYAVKELPPGLAQAEYNFLTQIEQYRLPCVSPVGYATLRNSQGDSSILITSYLEQSLPYRSLFMRSSLNHYREHLLDAMALLLVQLHLVGIFWGDCSLSNTLFRRDAGALQAYLVDAETAEVHLPPLAPMLRYHELEIMEENVVRDLADLETAGQLASNIPILETGEYIRQRYRSLWEEITREVIINPDEHYRLQERIRALNSLGFSVKNVEIQGSDQGEKLHLRIIVTDRNFHRDQLFELTGLEAEEMQARQMMNEIYELKAFLSQSSNHSIRFSLAANHWLEKIYQPVIDHLKPLIEHKDRGDVNTDPVELYCQILEHKWYLSESVRHDVGHLAAVEDFILKFGYRDC
jgi:hypothetical protein